ncbi:MAG: hypothetical protein ACI4L2_00170 [Wujia sp.]
MFMNILVVIMVIIVVLCGVYGWMVDHQKNKDSDDSRNPEDSYKQNL